MSKKRYTTKEQREKLKSLGIPHVKGRTYEEARSLLTAMPTKEAFVRLKEPVQLQIYQQKYLTHRHFDGLRWKTPVLVFASAGVIFGFSDHAGAARPFLLILFGIVALAYSYLLHRIRHHSDHNTRVLKAVAEAIGDEFVRDPPSWRCSAAFWFLLLTGVVGAISLVLGIIHWLSA